MGESKGHYFKSEQLRAIEDMVETGRAASAGEAVDLFVNEGMRQYGYRAGTNGDTWLKRIAGELARAFAYLGVAWLGFFALFPARFRLIGVAIVLLALIMTGLRVVLGQVEPRVTHALKRGESKA